MSVDKTLEKILKEINSIRPDLDAVKRKMATKSDLDAVKSDVEAIKGGMATKADLRATEKRLKKHVTDEVKESNEAIKAGIEGLQKEANKRFNKLEEGQRELKDNFNNLKWDTPTQKDFKKVKAKVDRYHPTN